MVLNWKPDSRLHSMSETKDDLVGRRISERRHELGMTRKHLAETLGVSTQQVQKYELGINRISASMLWEVKIALDVSIDFFFIETDDYPILGMLSSVAERYKEEEDIVSFFGTMSPEMRKAFLELARSLQVYHDD